MLKANVLFLIKSAVKPRPLGLVQAIPCARQDKLCRCCPEVGCAASASAGANDDASDIVEAVNHVLQIAGEFLGVIVQMPWKEIHSRLCSMASDGCLQFPLQCRAG